MASRRGLKKDIDYLTFAVIADCFTYNEYNAGNEEVASIVEDIVKLRNELRDLISNPQIKDKSETKAYYKSIFNSAISATDKSFSRLSEVIKNNK